MIELRTLGPVEILVDGVEPARELLWRKNLALLLYLARSPGQRRSREHLVGLLWGDKPDSTARHSLNEALRVLRRTGDEGLLDSVGDQVLLDQAAVSLDSDELEQRIAEQRWAEAVELVRGSWMEGFAVSDCSEFEDWLSAERVHWTSVATSAMQAHGSALLARGDEAGTQDVARRALALDPFSDGAIRLLMEAVALRGERASALSLYEEFTRRLETELGIEPEPDTAALAGRVRGSILKYFYVDGLAYLSDCLHAQPGQSAAEAVADSLDSLDSWPSESPPSSPSSSTGKCGPANSRIRSIV